MSILEKKSLKKETIKYRHSTLHLLHISYCWYTVFKLKVFLLTLLCALLWNHVIFSFMKFGMPQNTIMPLFASPNESIISQRLAATALITQQQ